ncbi:MAG: 4Fe-4S binding protein, partial [Prevotella sp.]|nr:4Fe-4S binding protein [Prevotella sp.]
RTLVLGRIYCSVIWPLGIMMDIFGGFGKKAKKNSIILRAIPT